MTFKEHRDKTAADCEEIIASLEALVEKIKEGDLEAFEKFWFRGGTEKGDGMIDSMREILAIRYAYRSELL